MLFPVSKTIRVLSGQETVCLLVAPLTSTLDVGLVLQLSWVLPAPAGVVVVQTSAAGGIGAAEAVFKARAVASRATAASLPAECDQRLRFY